MKKLFQAIIIILITTTALYAQQDRNLIIIHDAKMSYFQKRLRLTNERFRNFIPIYNQYEKEITDTRQAFFGKYKNPNPSETDDATSRQLIDDNLDYQQAVIEIKRKYNDRFLKVLTPQQLADLYPADREFRQMLMQRLKNKHIARPGR